MPEQPTLTDSPENSDDELKRLRALAEKQAVLIKQRRERIQELEARLANCRAQR